MRILYLTERFFPFIGGIETMSEYLLSSLHKAGYEIQIVTSHSAMSLPDEDTWQDIPLHRLHMLTSLTNRDFKGIFQARNKLQQIERSFQPDVIHVQFSGPSSLFQRNSKKVKTPTIITLHSIPQQVNQNRSLLLETLLQAKWVTAVSDYMLQSVRQQVQTITPRSNIVYNGIPELNIKEEINPLPSNPPCLLWVGRMVDWKRVDVIIRALAIIRRKFPNVVLILAGDGPERKSLETLAKNLHLTDYITFLGWVERKELQNVLSKATLVVIPSTSKENLPMVALESAQMARPIVASAVSGLPEIVQDGYTGKLLTEVTPQTLADMTCNLLKDLAFLRQMGKNAQQLVRERFTIARMVEDYIKIYETVTKT